MKDAILSFTLNTCMFMRRYLRHFLLLVLAYIPVVSYAEVVEVNSEDIPSNLKKAEEIKLVGTWDTDSFAELAVSIGTTGFGASNSVLKLVDMSETLILEGTDLYVNGGFTSNGVFVNCKALESVLMPSPAEAGKFDDMTKAFMNCSKLESIDMSGCSGITSLNNTFFGCSNLGRIDISSSVMLTKASSMASAFDGCMSLTEVILPSEIVFAENTFKDCTSLVRIDWRTFAGSEVPVFYYNMFSGIEDLKTITLVVMSSVCPLFEASEWNQLTLDPYSPVSVETVEAEYDICGNVYDMNGRIITVIRDSSELESLPDGIYIIGSRRLYLKRK